MYCTVNDSCRVFQVRRACHWVILLGTNFGRNKDVIYELPKYENSEFQRNANSRIEQTNVFRQLVYSLCYSKTFGWWVLAPAVVAWRVFVVMPTHFRALEFRHTSPSNGRTSAPISVCMDIKSLRLSGEAESNFTFSLFEVSSPLFCVWWFSNHKSPLCHYLLVD